MDDLYEKHLHLIMKKFKNTLSPQEKDELISVRQQIDILHSEKRKKMYEQLRHIGEPATKISCDSCEWSYDLYNINGDCLAEK